MRISVLIENTKPQESDLIAEHGLSLFIETENHNIISDTGASGAISENAEAMGIDLKKADIIVLSHGHYDHTGGMMRLSEINDNAKIFLSQNASKDFYNSVSEHHIGIDKNILTLKNLELINTDFFEIDDNLAIFSKITGRKYFPEGNRTLKVIDSNGNISDDDFSHEQCLVIRENGKYFLISGCAHNGIVNIIDRFHEIYNTYPDVVVSGFHMMKKDGYSEKDFENVRETAEILKDLPTVFYTGHCTGDEPFEILKEIMKEKIRRIYTGFQIEL